MVMNIIIYTFINVNSTASFEITMAISLCQRVLLYVLASLVIFKASAEPTNKITVVTEEWPPYNYLSGSGEIIGSATQIVESTLQHANVPYTLNIYPWARAYKNALEQPNVLIYSILRSPEREKLFHWVCPLNTIQYYFFKLSARADIQVNSIDDIKKYTLGLIRDSYMHNYLKTNGFVEGEHLQITGNNQANIKLLLAKRVDIIIDTHENIALRLKALPQTSEQLKAIYPIGTDIIATPWTCMAISLKTPIKLVDTIRKSHQAYIKQ